MLNDIIIHGKPGFKTALDKSASSGGQMRELPARKAVYWFL